MAIVRLQGEIEKRNGIYYQVDSADEPIGVGGMGQVFRGICVNERTGSTRPVAIKFMFDDLPPQAVERARREASIQLRNDNLVEMLGFIELDERTPSGEILKHYHVVSELLNGVSLYDLFEGKTTDRYGEEVPFAVKLLQDYKNDPEHFAKIVVINVLSGLLALHDAGYIHRDIDPSNIMVTSDGHIKLIDFGIAKQMNTLTTSDKSLTVAGKFMGKPEYAAPELALGDIKHQNQTTDIYAMGILLYQCIVGHTPFEGARHEILEKQLKAKLPLDVIKNKYLRAIIAKACEKKQELRFQSSAEMRVALENPNSMKSSLSKGKKIMIASGIIAVIVVLGIAGVITKNKQDAAEAQAEQVQFEQKKSLVISEMNDLIDKAEQASTIGLNTENDNFEDALINAYIAYEEAEAVVKRDSIYAIEMPNVSGKKATLMEALQTAKQQFKEQASQLREFGETEQADAYIKREEKVEKFINSHH